MDRLAMLETLVVTKPDDPFPRYGLAMEYKRLERLAEADAAFATLLEAHPSYVPAYLMYGNMLEAMGSAERAASIYARGVATAKAEGNEHALGELQAALDACS
jgi:tetratricopeptide (TPR) repeat protein